MLNIDEIQNGIVIDHIKAGTAVGLMELLGITGNKTANVALIQNARSHKADCGRKDIIKVEGDASWLNLDVLAYLDPDISVTVIENGKAVRKEKPKPPKRLVNIVRCRNPRCISSIEEECDQIFEMSSNGKYRCIYCEQELQVKPDESVQKQKAVRPTRRTAFFVCYTKSSRIGVKISSRMPASVQVQPCSTPSSFRPDLKQKKPNKAPSGSTARHPIPTYDAVQVQCIQKVSICSNPPRSPFRASSDFLFVKTFRPTHTRLRSRMFLPLSAANHTAGRRSCL